MSAPRLLAWLAVLAVCAGLALAGVGILAADRHLAATDAALAAGAAPARSSRPGLLDRVGSWLLGTEDDREYRDAYGLAAAAALPTADVEEVPRLRAEAERILAGLLRSSGDDRLRSRAANLLGELLFAEAKDDPRNPRRFTEQAYGAFQDAVSLDPSNAVARRNLELLARLPADLSFTEDPPPGDDPSASPDGGGGF